MPVWTETIEGELTAPGMAIRVSSADWARPAEFQQRPLEYVLALALSPQFTYTQICLATDTCAGSFLNAGNLAFIPADVDMQVRTSGGWIREMECHFDRDSFEELTGLEHNWNSDALSACLDIKNARLTQMLLRLAQETLTPGFASSKVAELLGSLAAIELARHFRSVEAKAKTANQTLSPWQIRRVTDHIETLASYTPDIAAIADLCGIGSRHLRRLFKETTDQTIYEYARGVWAAKAKSLLSDTNVPLKEISSQLGFSDPNSFSIAFRRAAGEAPKAFRQQFRRPPTHQ
jgi:AraC family transcriptional regulator